MEFTAKEELTITRALSDGIMHLQSLVKGLEGKYPALEQGYQRQINDYAELYKKMMFTEETDEAQQLPRAAR